MGIGDSTRSPRHGHTAPAAICTMEQVTASAADDPTLAGLSLEDKAALTSGANFWWTKPLEQLGIPSMMLTDGPHGLRKQREGGDHLGIGHSVPATCFPPAVALGSSWDCRLYPSPSPLDRTRSRMPPSA